MSFPKKIQNSHTRGGEWPCRRGEKRGHVEFTYAEKKCIGVFGSVRGKEGQYGEERRKGTGSVAKLPAGE